MSIDFSDDSLIRSESDDILSRDILPDDDGEGSLRPKTLAEYIGQEKAKHNLAVFIEGAKRRNEPLAGASASWWQAASTAAQQATASRRSTPLYIEEAIRRRRVIA